MSGYIEYCRNRAQTSVLQVYDLASGKAKALARFDRCIEAPNWTADGKYLIYNCFGEIFRYEIASGKSEKIATGIADTCNNDHVLQPGGSAIAVSSEADGGSRIFIVNPETGEAKTAVDKPMSYLHGWSPDGAMLAYCACRGGDWDIYTCPVTGGEEIRLTDAPGLNDGPEFAPDGKTIWFNSVRTGRMQVWRMNADGSRQTQMTFDPSMNAWFPHVSPDGRHVVYIAYHEGDLEPGQHLPDKHVEIRMIPYEGGEERTLLKLFGGQGTMNVNSWSPDGTKFAFVSYEA